MIAATLTRARGPATPGALAFSFAYTKSSAPSLSQRGAPPLEALHNNHLTFAKKGVLSLTHLDGVTQL